MKIRQKPFDNSLRRRMNIVLLFFFVLFSLLLGRIFIMQIRSHAAYSALAARQHRLVREIHATRGSIFMQTNHGDRVPLALNRIQKTLIASPRDIEDPAETAAWLAALLSLDEERLLNTLNKENDAYEIIAKKLDESLARHIEEKRVPGLFFEEEKLREYPYGSLASHLIGFVSKDEETEKGMYGLERLLDRDLAGKKGIFEGAKDAAGFWIALGRRILNPPKNGSDIVLTVDLHIQVKAEEVLRNVQAAWGAASGSVLVLEPSTGRILALANTPAFDPNQYGKEKDLRVFLNTQVEGRYEPGSVIKPIVMAAALEENAVGPNTTYTDTGMAQFGSYTIRNFDGNAYGEQTMMNILEKSLNTGMIFVAQKLGKTKQLEYLKRFGFDEKTGIDLPGEIGGAISHLGSGRDIDYATAAFGQGIAVTPMQLASAIAAIANGGTLMTPYIVEKIVDDSGNERVTEPTLRRRVISPETAETISKMLVSAVRNGFENRAGVKGYFVAGKTGTAQVSRTDGRGYSDNVIHTFVGYAPAFSPRFLILLQLNDPKGNRFAANTLTPAFHELAQFILNYYEVPPDER